MLLLALFASCQSKPLTKTWHGVAHSDQAWPYQYILTREDSHWTVTSEQQLPGSKDWVPIWGPAEIITSGDGFVEFRTEWGVPGKALRLGFRLEFPTVIGDNFEAQLLEKGSSKKIPIAFSKIEKQ